MDDVESHIDQMIEALSDIETRDQAKKMLARLVMLDGPGFTQQMFPALTWIEPLRFMSEPPPAPQSQQRALEGAIAAGQVGKVIRP